MSSEVGPPGVKSIADLPVPLNTGSSGANIPVSVVNVDCVP